MSFKKRFSKLIALEQDNIAHTEGTFSQCDSRLMNSDVRDPRGDDRDSLSPQTYIGTLLVSLNPYKELDIYSKKQMDSYMGVNFFELPPHM